MSKPRYNAGMLCIRNCAEVSLVLGAVVRGEILRKLCVEPLDAFKSASVWLIALGQ